MSTSYEQFVLPPECIRRQHYLEYDEVGNSKSIKHRDGSRESNARLNTRTFASARTEREEHDQVRAWIDTLHATE